VSAKGAIMLICQCGYMFALMLHTLQQCCK
jgi:hypothetical protein